VRHLFVSKKPRGIQWFVVEAPNRFGSKPEPRSSNDVANIWAIEICKEYKLKNSNLVKNKYLLKFKS